MSSADPVTLAYAEAISATAASPILEQSDAIGTLFSRAEDPARFLAALIGTLVIERALARRLSPPPSSAPASPPAPS